MNSSIFKMRRLLSILVCTIGVANNSWSASINAASCSQSNVASAISQAAVGDTIQVPAGSCSWSGLSISKAIHLKGAGAALTKINLSGSNTVIKQSTGITRISGFGFSKNGGGNESKGWYVTGSWKNAEPVIFQDNDFNISNSGLFRIFVAGGVIIANNSFTGGWDDSFIQPKDDNDSGKSWGTADTMGSKDTTGKLNIYVEGNTFYGGTNQGIDCDDSSRCVYRYNTLTYSSFNTHGMATSPTGVRHFEVYHNQFNHDGGTSQIANQNWAIWIRGGTGVIFNNKIDDLAGSYWGNKSEISFTIRGAEDVRPQGSCSNVKYPVPRQVGQNHNGTNYFTDPIYIWGNTGTAAIGEGWNWGDPCGFTWGTFFKWGRDAMNGTMKPGYTPYTYPHPLVKAGGGGVTPVDNTAPSVPNGLAAAAESSTAINLTWGASTDDVKVTGYRLERCTGTGCTNFTQIATPSGLSYSDIGLSPNTTYRYRVRATDVAGNMSGYSTEASAKTLDQNSGADNSAPTAPSGLQATAISSNQIELSWSASTDNVGVTGYRVERCAGSGCTNFVQIATPTNTSYTNSGLSANTTYRYRVRAQDAAANLSAYSSLASELTLSSGGTGGGSSSGNTDVYYVDKTAGNDNNPGTLSQPWKNAPGMKGSSAHTGNHSLSPGDTVYFDQNDTWTVSGSPEGFYLVGGVHYIGDEWTPGGGNTGARAIIRAGNDFNENGVVRFRDHATIETVFKGFEVDVNNMAANGIDINHGFWSLMNGATKRVENVEVHHVFTEQSKGEYKYGIAMSNWGGSDGILENVEIINCSVHDIGRDAVILYPSDDPNSKIGNILVRGCEIYNTGQDPNYFEGHGIVVKGWVYNSKIEYNYIHNVNSSAVFISGPEDDGSQRAADNVIIRNNILTTQDNNGIIRLYKKGAKNLKIYGNILYDNDSTGGLSLDANSGSLDLLVYNNTFYNAFVDFGRHSSNVKTFEFKNNIVQYPSNPLRNAGAIQSQSNNLIVTSDPGFKNPANKPTGFIGQYNVDIRPNTNGLSLNAGSSAIDGGTTLLTNFNGSINSVFRPQGLAWDIGAYEVISIGSVPLLPPYNLKVNP